MKSISILGAGSWGFALAIAISQVAKVTLWSRNLGQIQRIKATRINLDYLPANIMLPLTVNLTNELASALKSDLLIIATPLNSLRVILGQIKALKDNALVDIIWLCKGMELGSSMLPHQIIQEILGDRENVGGLLGPSFAEEVALGKPTAITLTSKNLAFALKWIKIFNNIPNFRLYANTDVIGSELGAAVKNIMAIAVGIADGLGLGFNARSALITRSLNELRQLVLLLGGCAETVYGLTGIGDLILTCTGDLSRNRKVGIELAQGQQIEDILANLGHVAEGVYATKEVYQLSQRLKLEMPIVEAVYNIIYEKASLNKVVFNLITRETKLEFN